MERKSRKRFPFLLVLFMPLTSHAQKNHCIGTAHARARAHAHAKPALQTLFPFTKVTTLYITAIRAESFDILGVLGK